MRLGVRAEMFIDLPLERALDEIVDLGIEGVEVSSGNYARDTHCPTRALLANGAKLGRFKRAFDDRGLFISALNCSGNPLHPQRSIAESHVRGQHDSILLAEKLGLDRIVCFSGCPGDSDSSRYPNWVTCTWPDDYPKVLEWQWREKVIPFWQREADFAEKHGVDKLCLEMHPGLVVYNPPTLLRLREEVGKVIGVNFDPSHLFWQGIDPAAAIMKMRDSIYHTHAKDTYLNRANIGTNGVLDITSKSTLRERPWHFRTVGYGHGTSLWKKIMSSFRMVGYDYVLCIEHEDALLSRKEGLSKAVDFLNQVMIRDSAVFPREAVPL